jgi:hypothetical protein
VLVTQVLSQIKTFLFAGHGEATGVGLGGAAMGWAYGFWLGTFMCADCDWLF